MGRVAAGASERPDDVVDPATFRLGIVGTGLITTGSHLPAALGLPGSEVRALVDPVLARAGAVARTFGISPRLVPAVDEVLDDVDGVIIATPNSTHSEIALQCIAAGVHALIEKPLATTVSEGEAIADAARRAGVTVATGFCTRFRPNVELLKELLDEGYFGSVFRFAHQFGTAGGWAPLSAYNLSRTTSGGGVLVVSATHFLDRMLYFWGYPSRAMLLDDGFGGPEANCTATFSYGSFSGVGRYSKTAALPSGLVIETERGVVVLEDTDDAVIRFHPAQRPGLCEHVVRDRAGEDAAADVFQLQLLDFVEACRGRRTPRVDVVQGIASLRLVEQLYANRAVSRENWYA